MFKFLILSGSLCSAIACSINVIPTKVDTVSPGVVAHGPAVIFIDSLGGESWDSDTTYQYKLERDFEELWEKNTSIFLVQAIDVQTYLVNDSADENFKDYPGYTNFDVTYSATEYSWKGEELFNVVYKDTIILFNCGTIGGPSVYNGPLIYWSNDFKNENNVDPSKGYSTFMEDGEIRIENRKNHPYVSLSLDSSFAFHRGEISPINNSSTIGNTHYLGYDSKGVLLGQFTQEEKKAFELESPVEKVFFKRMNQYKGWSKYD